MKAEDRAHRRGQTSAVNIYIFCAKVLYLFGNKILLTFLLYMKIDAMVTLQGTLDESHWSYLNRSLRHISSTTNGKYDAIQEIQVCPPLFLSYIDDHFKESADLSLDNRLRNYSKVQHMLISFILMYLTANDMCCLVPRLTRSNRLLFLMYNLLLSILEN